MGLDISFSGCAWNFTFQIGVARYLQETFNLEDARFCGASAGVLSAAALAAGVSWTVIRDNVFTFAKRSRRYPTGPFFNIGRWQKEYFAEFLNDKPDFYKRLSGRLFISVTRFPPLRNELVSEFKDNNHFMACMLGSQHIPFYSGGIVVHERRFLIDGGFTANSPRLSKETIVVSPTHRSACIAPRKPYFFAGGLFVDTDEVMERKIEEGYLEAQKYFALLMAREGRDRFGKLKVRRPLGEMILSAS